MQRMLQFEQEILQMQNRAFNFDDFSAIFLNTLLYLKTKNTFSCIYLCFSFSFRKRFFSLKLNLRSGVIKIHKSTNKNCFAFEGFHFQTVEWQNKFNFTIFISNFSFILLWLLQKFRMSKKYIVEAFYSEFALL